jgi:hypothetical protein
MEFSDHQIHIDIFGERVTVVVKADLIRLFRGADTGQTAEGIIDANIDVISTLAEEKVINGAEGEITIGEADYEGSEDPAEESHETHRRLH